MATSLKTPALIGRPWLPGVALVIAAMAAACGTIKDKATAGADIAAVRQRSPQTALSTVTADTQRVVIAVKGMYCSSCEQTIVTMLRRTAGVVRADVSLDRAEATVSYDSSRTPPTQLVQVVKSLGYDASVKHT